MVLEYRRLGRRSGGYLATLDDVRAGFNAVAADPRLPGPRVVVGHSAGGQLALWLAGQVGTSGRIAGVVSLAGCVNLELATRLGLGGGAVEDFLGGTPAEAPQAYAQADPLNLLPCPVPTVLIHGDADAEVPVAVSESYAIAARRSGADVRLVRLPGVGHYELIEPGSGVFRTLEEVIGTFEDEDDRTRRPVS